MQTWSYDSRILQNWMWVLFSMLIGLLLVILLMILSNSSQFELENILVFFESSNGESKKLPLVLKIIYWLLGVVLLVCGSV